MTAKSDIKYLSLPKVIDATGPVRLKGRWSKLTYLNGYGYLVFTAVLIILGLPFGLQLVTQSCESRCYATGQLTLTNIHDLENIGISVSLYSTIYITVLIVFSVVCLGLAGFILWKKPGELLPLCAAIYIIDLVAREGRAVFFSDLLNTYPFLGVIYNFVNAFIVAYEVYLFTTFPTGKFKGKVFYFIFVVGGIGTTVTSLILFFFPTDSENVVFILTLVPGLLLSFVVMGISLFRDKDFSKLNLARYLGYTLVCILAIVITSPVLVALTFLVILVSRSLTVLNQRERNQTKWFIYGFVFYLVVFALVLPLLAQLQDPGTYWFLILNFMGFFGCGFILVTATLMSLLFANAFDINLVIKRTIVYSILTFLIIGIYVGSVIGLQALVRTLTGQQSDLAIVGATIISLLVFQPLRRFIQHFIDRRFYRHKYDAARTIADLNYQLKSETDLKTLASSLQGVLIETLQPEQVTVWFRKTPSNTPSQDFSNTLKRGKFFEAG